MLKDFATLIKDFQSSVNIAFDLYNDDKLLNFIPTSSSLQIIEEIIQSTHLSSKQRARILIGAYGRGKSHAILVLLNLLSNRALDLNDRLLKRIKINYPDTYEIISNYLNNGQKLLPIVISGNNTNLTQSFMISIQQALNHAGLNNLLPKTTFKSALLKIKDWKINYPETFTAFCTLLDSSIDDFQILLKEYNITAYEKFVSLYPKLTAGSEFSPFSNFNVVEVYSDVAMKLSEAGYTGLFVVYDEFSKYLESSINSVSISDIKLLQDFAEKCDRSGQHQMHLLLISHKDISNYIDDYLPKDKVDGWRGVSGRFVHINIQNHFSEVYELISSVIQKGSPKWFEFLNQHTDQFAAIYNRFLTAKIFINDVNHLKTTIIEGCYPLHPCTSFILPRLSERVAQNERTLFTYLSSDHKNTLSQFISKNDEDLPFVTLDRLFDYFEPLLRKEKTVGSAYFTYILASKLLMKIDDDSLESKIIKSLALIYIVEQFDSFPPTVETIHDIFYGSQYELSAVNHAMQNLIDRDCIVYLKRSNHFLKLKENSGLNVQQEIRKDADKLRSVINLKEIINQANIENYLYPIKYNDEKELIRYFKVEFIESAELLNTANLSIKFENSDFDGLIIPVITKNYDDLDKVKLWFKENHNKYLRIIFVILTEPFDITEIAYDFQAATKQRSAITEDHILSEEYDLYIEDLGNVLMSYINKYISPSLKQAEFYHLGQKIQISRRAHLTDLMSTICWNLFPDTPVVNNEVLVKNILSRVAINSRNKVVEALLDGNQLPNLGLSGSGQEVSFLRSMLVQTNILTNTEYDSKIDISNCDSDIKIALDKIGDFLASANNREGKNLSELYDFLIKPEYKLGLKKGIIPIIIAVQIRLIGKPLIFKSNGKEVKITSDLLNAINENPQNYTVQYIVFTDEANQYVGELEEIFSKYIIERERNINNYSYLVQAMYRWYMGLPRYSKEFNINLAEVEFIDSHNIPFDKYKAFINTIKIAEPNAQELIFNKIPKIFGFNEPNSEVVTSVQNLKSYFDLSERRLFYFLKLNLKKIFSTSLDREKSLYAALNDWYSDLTDVTRSYSFSQMNNQILNLIKELSYDEDLFIENVGRTVSALRINDWNNQTIENFLSKMIVFKNEVDTFNAESKSSMSNENGNFYRISSVDEYGNEVVRSFEKITYSPKAKLLYNDISVSLEEIGQAISDQEKRQVLIEILSKLI